MSPHVEARFRFIQSVVGGASPLAVGSANLDHAPKPAVSYRLGNSTIRGARAVSALDYRSIAHNIMDALSDINLPLRPHFRVLPTPKQEKDPRLWDVDERNSAGFIIEDKSGAGGPYRTHVAFKVRTGTEDFVEVSFVVEATLTNPIVIKEAKVDGRSTQFTIGKGRPVTIEIPVVGGSTPQSVNLRLIKDVKEKTGSNQILFKIANDTERARPKTGSESFEFGNLLDFDVYEESSSPIAASIDEIKGYGLLPESES